MQRRKITAILMALMLFAATAVAAQGNGDETHSDLWLKAKIVTAYTLNRYLNPFKLDVEVKDGVAHLSGTVDSDVERDLAVEIAMGVDGITEVDENITIEPGAMAGQRKEPKFFRTVEDATITARVKSKLLWNRNTNGLDIAVSTKNGVVTLEGKVASGAHKDLAVQLAKNTSGVERVVDKLVVSGEKEKTKKKSTIEKLEGKTNDAWITTKVKSILLFSKEADGADIEVSTTNQIVTLKGTVGSKEQEKAVINIVNDTVGVKGVVSELVVDKG